MEGFWVFCVVLGKALDGLGWTWVAFGVWRRLGMGWFRFPWVV